VYSYLHHAFLCDVLRPHPSFEDWLAGTFLRLYAHRDVHRSNVPFNFDVGDRLVANQAGHVTHELLHYYQRIQILALQAHDRSILEKDDCAALLREWTNDGWAVMLHADKNHLPGPRDHRWLPHIQQVLLTAGDTSSKSLRVHYMNASGRYIRVLVPLPQVIHACVTARIDAPHSRVVMGLRPRWDNFQARITPAFVRSELDRAILGEGTTLHDVRDAIELAYGLQASTMLREWATQMLRGQLAFDVRPFHVFMEHKQRLESVLRLLAGRGQGSGISQRSLEEASSLVERATALRFVILRGQATGATVTAVPGWEAHTRETLALEAALHRRLRDEMAKRVD
jgi:hypothetical protein